MKNKEFSVLEHLLTHKNIEPLDQLAVDELKRIQDLDIFKFTEADVRAEIIDPIVKILGYRKGQFASVDREKHIKFLRKSKYIDYNITLWEENFWIIEAKKPLGGDSFGYDELSQAIEYSIHPNINASIIVLCDGKKLELFDREDTLEKPILSFKITDLIVNFDSLRKILCPIQIWFFYKRRVLKAIDKAFEKEFNQKRVNEFLKIIENRFREKRGKILNNFRSNNYTDQGLNEEILKANIDEIIDVYYFFRHSVSTMSAMNQALINECNKNNFIVLNKIFPESYRDTNDAYYANALGFLVQLNKEIKILNWAPSWLVKNVDRTSENMIKGLIKHSLNYFKDDESRRIILLASAVFRRIFKILFISKPDLRVNCEANHLLIRHVVPENSWKQILSSPQSSIMSEIDSMTMIFTDKLVKDFSTDRGYKFNTNLAKQKLQNLWLTEKAILQETPNYFELEKEVNLGEIYPTEMSSIVYDSLGHHCLCVLKDSEEWREYILNNHRVEVENLAITGSWVAQEVLGKNDISNIIFDKNKYCVERFFFGDKEMLSSLKALYKQIIS